MAEHRQMERGKGSHYQGVKEIFKKNVTFKLSLRAHVRMCSKDEQEKAKDNSRKRGKEIPEIPEKEKIVNLRDNVCHTNCVNFSTVFLQT